MFSKKLLVTAIAAAVTGSLALTHNAFADKNSFIFKPIESSANSADWNPAAPWKLPKGFEQMIVSDETALNIYTGGRDDWHDMNTVNETGPMAGRFMYRTHEVRGEPEGGAVSVVNLETGETKVLAQDPTWDALDGIRWTSWGTILFAEEIDGGRLLEIVLDENDRMTAAEVIDRPAVGRLAHEGIDVDAQGNVYVVDEHRGRSEGCNGVVPCGGGVYKFVPNTYGDLSAGSLYVLKVTGKNGVGQGEWVGPIDPLTAREAGTAAGGQSYQRPEDLEIIGDTLYVAITEGPRDAMTETDPAQPNYGQLEFKSELYEGRVIAINLNTMMVTNFIMPGVNVPVEIGRPGDEGFQTGFDSVDNLAESPDGRLLVVEDNVPSDIWFASTKTDEFGASLKVDLFGSLSDSEAEGTGIYFSPFNPHTLYVNVQHSAADDGDATWAISKTRRRD
ncbi:MAG: PhoX family protein [Gammaproteobacteria bacterium]|nr:PhoX family protein [Gammaproteobacteria bacterium]